MDIVKFKCSSCGGDMTARDDKGVGIVYGVPRRGMTDGALSCPHCGGITLSARSMGAKVIGVELNNVVEWHVPGVSGPDYMTLCGLDGDDPSIGQTGTVDAPHGTKINCAQCRTIWQRLRQLKLREADFVDA